MASHWIVKRPRKRKPDKPQTYSYRVMYRVGGRESSPQYAGAFATKREAQIREDWVAGELASMRVPDLARTVVAVPTLREVAARWQESRKDVREATTIQHRTSLHHVNRLLGDRECNAIGWEDVQRMEDVLAAEKRARESIRKCRTALSMVLDYAGVSPNAARDKRVKLPLSEPEEVQPPHADHVEAAGWLLSTPYLIGLLVLDATGARVGELAAAKIGDLDEGAQGVARSSGCLQDPQGALGQAPRRSLRRSRRPSSCTRGSGPGRVALSDRHNRPSPHRDLSRLP